MLNFLMLNFFMRLFMNWFGKQALAYVGVDLQTRVNFDQKDIFQGSLEQALEFAKKHFYKLELIFDYDAGYLFVKTIPSAMELKNRINWELYQKQDLFSNKELIETFQYPWCTVWLTLSNISFIVKKFRKQIKTIRWLGYELYQATKKIFVPSGESVIYVLGEENRTILLGVVNQALLTCRVIDNKTLLKTEIEETAAFLAKFDAKSCDVYVFKNDYTFKDDLNLPSWFKVHMDCQKRDSEQMNSSLLALERFGLFVNEIDTFAIQNTLKYIGLFCFALIGSFYSLYQWNTENIDNQHQELLSKQTYLNNKLAQYPNLSHMEKLDIYNNQFLWEKDLVKKIIRFLHKNGALVKGFIWKERILEIEFIVRTPTNYQQFLQVGNLLNKVLKMHFPNTLIELEKDVSIQKTDLQSYKYKLLF